MTDQVVFVLTARPLDNGRDHWRTFQKMAQAVRELREDGVQLVDVSIHIKESAERVRNASQSP